MLVTLAALLWQGELLHANAELNNVCSKAGKLHSFKTKTYYYDDSG